jgi:hypothetical protein
MFGLGVTKRRLGQRLDSGAMAGEGIQNLMRAAQAAAVFAGLVIVAVWPVAGRPILSSPWYRWVVSLGGSQSWRGAGCC